MHTAVMKFVAGMKTILGQCCICQRSTIAKFRKISHAKLQKLVKILPFKLYTYELPCIGNAQASHTGTLLVYNAIDNMDDSVKAVIGTPIVRLTFETCIKNGGQFVFAMWKADKISQILDI